MKKPLLPLYKKFLKEELSTEELIALVSRIDSEEGVILMEEIFNQDACDRDKYGIYPDRKAEILKSIKSQIRFSRPQKEKIYMRILRYAALFLLPVSLAWGVYNYMDNRSESELETVLVVGEHSHSQITLDDNTKIYLSANSSISYPKRFAGVTREVKLQGEAFFEVAKENERPFIVKTDQQTVRVIGTSFNIRAFRDEPIIETTLVEGSIELSAKGNTILVKPGEQVSISKETGALNIKDTDINTFMSWKTGKYVFRNYSFEEIVKVLEKGFDTNIHVKNEKLKKRLYTMRFENGESLEKIIDLIRIEGKFNYYYKNGILIIE